MADRSASRDRWRPRPALSLGLRLAVLVVPILCSVAAAWGMSTWLPRPPGGPALLGWWVAVVAASLGALTLVDLLVRRLLPLAALLRLSMLFPDQAPSRMRVARRAGITGAVERQLAKARELDEGAPPAAAAEIILTLVTALSTHDRRTRGHSERVHLFADLLGDEMGLDDGDRQRLRWAAMLHDIGKLDIDARLLNKPAAPDEDEWERIRHHPDVGRQLIAPIAPWLGEWAAAVDQHHERYDGGGYPQGLAGEDIARAARIVSVADAYEVMTAPRPYRRPVGPEAARRELAACAGTQFDPAVVRAFLNISIGKLRRIVWPMAVLAAAPVLPRPAAAANAPVGSAAAALVAAGFVVGGGLMGGSGPAEADPLARVVERPEVPLAAELGEPDEQVLGMRVERPAPELSVETAGPHEVETEEPSRLSELVEEPAARPSLPPPPRPTATRPDPATTPDAQPDAEPTLPRHPDGTPERPQPAPPSQAPAPTPRLVVDPTEEPQAVGSRRAAPIALEDVVTTAGSTPVVIDVLANDELLRDVGALRVLVAPVHGRADVGPGWMITYTPDAGAMGTDRFRYKVCYADGGCATAWVTVSITQP